MIANRGASCFIPPVFSARVAELVDAHDSGSCVRKDVEVRFLSRAPLKYWNIKVSDLYSTDVPNAGRK